MEGHMNFTIKLKECIVREVDWITLSQDRARLPALGNVDEIRDFEFQLVFLKIHSYSLALVCV
jgi:hypothetical protein